jgi:hypothetical protein
MAATASGSRRRVPSKRTALQTDIRTDSSSISPALPSNQRTTDNTSEDDECSISDNETPPPSPSSSEPEQEDEKAHAPAQTGWTTVINDVHRDPFTTPSGCQTPAATVLDCFRLMLNQYLVATIAENTTAYARHKGNDATWSTDVDEMYLFIAVHIRMGIVRLDVLGGRHIR